MAAAVLTIDINARLAKLEQGLAQANSGIVKFSRGIEGAGELARKSLEAIGVGFSVGAIVEGLRSVRDMALDEQRSIGQLNAVLKATGSAAGLTATQLEELGQSVKATSIFNEDDIRKAETALLRFSSIRGEVFERALRDAPDLAAALGVTLPAAAELLGRAISNPAVEVRGLRAAGVQLSEQQKELAQRFVETGDRAQGAAVFLTELEKHIGGAAGADNEGAIGASKRLTRAWDDMLKTLGRKITGDGAVSDHLTRSVQALTSDIDKAGDHWKAFLLLLATGPAGASNFQGQIAVDNALESAKRRTASGRITDAGEPGPDQIALLGKVNSRVGELSDAAFADNKLALQKQADLTASFNTSRLATLKLFLDLQQSALDFSYSRGEVSTATYYRDLSGMAAVFSAETLAKLASTRAAQEKILNATNGGQPLFSKDERAAADQRIQSIDQQVAQAKLTGDKRSLDIEHARILAIRNLTDEYAKLDAQISESEGDSAKLASTTFDIANRERIASLRSERDAAAGAGLSVNVGKASRAITELEILRQQTIAQAGLNDITREYGRIVDAVGIKQEQVDIEQQRGSLNEIEAIGKKSELARQYIPLLNAQIEKFRAIADNQDLPAVLREDALLNVQKMTLEVSRLSLQTDALSRKFNDIGSGAFSTFLTDLVDHTKSAKQALLDMFKSIDQSIAKVAADNLSQKLFGKDGAFGGFGDLLSGLFGGKSGGASGAGGAASGAAGAASAAASATGVAALGTAASATTLSMTTANSGLFALTGAAQAAATALLSVSTSGGASTLGSATSGLFGSAFDAGSTLGFAPFANGTNYAPGGLSLVGERAPELVKLPRGAQVIPNDVLRTGGSKKSNVYNMPITVNVAPGTSSATVGQTATAVGSAVSRALRRHG